MKIAELYRYPIKSARPCPLDRVLVQRRGFEQDRRWMLVDAEGVFCSQRTLPELGKLAVEITPKGICIDNHLDVPAPDRMCEHLEVKVWKDTLKAWGVSKAVDDWLSTRLGQEVRLVRMADGCSRKTPQGCPVSFADGYPVLITNRASLRDLNKRIGKGELSMRAFRPNLVVESDAPWAEDGWKQLQIGEVTLKLISPCERCKMTTLDPEDPHKVNAKREPLKTLATFRKQGNRVTFGWNAVLEGAPNLLCVGDEVRVLA